MIVLRDPEWCHEQELFSDDRFIVAEGNSSDADMCLMSLCQYHIAVKFIIPHGGDHNCQESKTIMPKLWFGDELS